MGMRRQSTSAKRSCGSDMALGARELISIERAPSRTNKIDTMCLDYKKETLLLAITIPDFHYN